MPHPILYKLGIRDNLPILVCKPKIPSRRDVNKFLMDCRKSGYITNNGPLVRRFESELKSVLGVSGCSVTSSGTIALTIMLKVLKARTHKSEVITTPFTFIATASAIAASGCRPVFVDIEPNSPFLSCDHVDSHITEKTMCVLTTHVYGFNAYSQKLQDVCDSHRTPLVFDAAHAVGCSQSGASLPSLGYASIISTHATKALSTAEGGAIISKDEEFISLCNQVRDFSYALGSQLPRDFDGVNGKQSELHAAFGLANLKTFQEDIRKRSVIAGKYLSALSTSKTLRPLSDLIAFDDSYVSNHSYFPIIPKAEYSDAFNADHCVSLFARKNILPRRYFYPSLDSIGNNSVCPNSRALADKVICLPCHSELSNNELKRILSHLATT